MTIPEFTYLLHNPQQMTAQQMTDVISVIDEFPYFQSAKALYLKALKNKESFKYNSQLKKTAAYTTDRSVLFDFITSDTFLQNKISEQIKSNTEHLKEIDINDIEDISVNKSVIIDEALKQHIKDAAPILDPSLFKEKEKVTSKEDSIIEVDTKNIASTPEEKLQIGKPLEFDKNEKHSFAEWLQITSFKPIIREDESKPKIEIKKEQTSKFDLIDKFIKANPKIAPVKKETAPLHNIASAQMQQPDTLMTETLARIYLEQKNYDKAIQAYKILSLKYPEKSGFFADQIQAVKELKKQNK